MNLAKTLALLLAAGALLGAGFIGSGAYNIAADEPHWAVTTRLIEALREKSIAARARGIEVPAGVVEADPERLRRGAGNYAAMCTGCHLAPGVADAELRAGLYPQPPDLARAVGAAAPGPEDARRLAARRFWIIKHGLKMTGMPAWSLGGMDDAAIWDMVTLVAVLPGMSPEAYAQLVASSDGHSHAGAHGAEGHGTGAPADHVDAPGSPPHSHAPKAAKPAAAKGTPESHDHDH